MRSLIKTIAGWGNFPAYPCRLFRAERLREQKEILCTPNESFIARGLGRAYGDAAINADHGVVLQERFNRFLAFDQASGMLECEAGVSFEDLLQTFVPRGFFPPTTPGTKFITVGGAVAADVHGKNHHCDGSFSKSVDSFRLMLANGDVVTASRTDHADLFWATIGGMGLTGILTSVKFRLSKIPSSRLNVHFEKTKSLDETLARFTTTDAQFANSVCWLDTVASGSKLGRAVMMLGNFATPAELGGMKRLNEVSFSKKRNVPFFLPEFVLNSLSVSLFNRAYYAHFSNGSNKVQTIDQYFYPLDAIDNWNRGYGKSGFLQFQAVWPNEQSAAALKKTLEEIQKAGANAFLAVLKTMGAKSEGMLSFPIAGHTLALDIPYRGKKTEALAKRLNALTLDFGGRVYLAKDAFLTREQTQKMYPDFDKFLAVKHKYDPNGRFASSLSKRLGLV